MLKVKWKRRLSKVSFPSDDVGGGTANPTPGSAHRPGGRFEEKNEIRYGGRLAEGAPVSIGLGRTVLTSDWATESDSDCPSPSPLLLDHHAPFMPTPPKTVPHKNALNIRLAESVVFLRAGDATGRQRTIQPDAAPGMVRGLLVLTLAKPTRITSIEVELVGRTMTAWPEGVCLSVCDPAPPDQRPGVGARRIEITEEHDIHSQTSVFFRAGHTPGSSSRRNLSVGPGLVLEHEDEDHSEQSSVMQPEGRGEERGRGRSPPRDPASARSHRRHMSVDQTHFQRSAVSHRENRLPPIASPPYSPTYSLDESIAQMSPTSTVMPRSPVSYADDSPARSLEDLRRALEADPAVNGASPFVPTPDVIVARVLSSPGGRRRPLNL